MSTYYITTNPAFTFVEAASCPATTPAYNVLGTGTPEAWGKYCFQSSTAYVRDGAALATNVWVISGGNFTSPTGKWRIMKWGLATPYYTSNSTASTPPIDISNWTNTGCIGSDPHPTLRATACYGTGATIASITVEGATPTAANGTYLRYDATTWTKAGTAPAIGDYDLDWVSNYWYIAQWGVVRYNYKSSTATVPPIGTWKAYSGGSTATVTHTVYLSS